MQGDGKKRPVWQVGYERLNFQFQRAKESSGSGSSEAVRIFMQIHAAKSSAFFTVMPADFPAEAIFLSFVTRGKLSFRLWNM